MLVILEGCDGVGKTTLANLLKPVLGAEIVHCTTQTPNTFEFFDALIYSAREKNIIVDRFCYSQFVYQEETNIPLAMYKLHPIDEPERYVKDSWEALRYLEMNMLQDGVRLIYVTADAETISKRLCEREETADIYTILQGYEDLWKRTLIQPIRYVTQTLYTSYQR